ncbi:GIY-YIG nuclease family protein [Mammaliicoccus sciuri]|uniref:GIY-YIG nuclease family protein n=1 Tax=Mammaliicoccus sciuri TaxID=1296 RepID=UPI0036E21D91
MKFEVYKITNKINGKAYIGITTVGIKKRYIQHCKAKSCIGYAIRKYGKENFEVSLIDVANGHKELIEKEKYWIDYHGTFSNGYNMTVGGEGKSLNKRIRVELNEKQMKFLKYVECENKKEIDVENCHFMVKTILLNLMRLFLLSENEKDKRDNVKLLCKLKPNLLEQILKTNVINKEELTVWNI